MELRMYGLVNYQLTGIQKGIQFLHGVVEYGQKYKNTELYNKWANEYKTVILLDGGTTSDKLIEVDDVFIKHGSLNRHLDTIKEMDIPVAEFREPDLGDQLTAVVLIVSEDVFNIPTNGEYMKKNGSYTLGSKSRAEVALECRQKEYGEENVELKDFLSQFRLA